MAPSAKRRLVDSNTDESPGGSGRRYRRPVFRDRQEYLKGPLRADQLTEEVENPKCEGSKPGAFEISGWQSGYYGTNGLSETVQSTTTNNSEKQSVLADTKLLPTPLECTHSIVVPPTSHQTLDVRDRDNQSPLLRSAYLETVFPISIGTSANQWRVLSLKRKRDQQLLQPAPEPEHYPSSIPKSPSQIETPISIQAIDSMTNMKCPLQASDTPSESFEDILPQSSVSPPSDNVEASGLSETKDQNSRQTSPRDPMPSIFSTGNTMKPLSIESNVHRELLKSKNEGNNAEIIEHLQHQGLSASSLQDFFNVQLESQIPKQPKLPDALLSKLRTYVIGLRTSGILDPAVAAQDKTLFARVDRKNPASVEAFLINLWQRLQYKPRNTCFNEELYTGPWFDLVYWAGPQWVAYVILRGRVLRPWGGSQSGIWLDLTSAKRWNAKQGTKVRKYIEKSAPARYGDVSKQSIMYRLKERIPLKVEFAIFSGQWKTPLCEELINTVISRFKSYASLSRRRQQLLLKNRGKSEKKGQAWTSIKNVVNFLTALLKRLLPHRLLGGASNFKAFSKSLMEYLKKPGYSKTSVATFSKKLKISLIPWLREIPSNQQQCALMRVIYFLISVVVNPLLAHHFYITEISGKPTSIYYYEKSVWRNNFERPGKMALIDRMGTSLSQTSTPMDLSIASESTASGESAKKPKVNETSVHADHAEAAHVRFVPKPDGSIRPIINLKEFNKQLLDAHTVLYHTMKPNYNRLNSWQDWIVRLLKFKTKNSEAQKFYVVQTDISGCYDNAKVDAVKRILNNALDDGRGLYRSQRVRSLNVRSNTLKDKEIVVELPRSQNSSKDREVEISDDSVTTAQKIVFETYSNKIISGASIIKSTDRLFDALRIRLSNRISVPFRQGIPQGSSCSLDLCNMMLDDLVERNLSEFTSDSKSMLIRYVDDFLFVSTDLNIANSYLNRMRAGFKDDYGVWCKTEKMITNFPGQYANGSLSGSEKPLENKATSYLGIEFFMNTLEIVIPRIDSLKMKFDGPNGSHVALKRMLDWDMNTLMTPLRSCHRNGVAAPFALTHKTAINLGIALAHRLPAYLVLQRSRVRRSRYRHQTGAPSSSTNAHILFYRLVNRIFAKIIPEKEREKFFRVIKVRYDQEGSRVGPHYIELKPKGT